MSLSVRMSSWRQGFADLLSQPRYVSILTFALALIVRVTYNLTVAHNYIPVHDAAEYDQLARHLLDWQCYCSTAPTHPTTYRPPVFPFFLAGVYLVSGADPLHARLALSIVGSITCVLVSIIARDLFGKRAGLLAGVLAATYPQLFIFDAWLYSESLAICLFVASCLAAMRVVRQPISWRWLLVGALFGLTALVRPNGVYALVAVFLWAILALWKHALTLRRAAAGVTLIVLGCLIIITPWAIRNALVTRGAFIPLSTGSGIVIAGAYNDRAYADPSFRGTWINPLSVPGDAASMQQFPSDCWGVCEVARDETARDLGIHWVLTHLQLIPGLIGLRLVQFWSPASPPTEAGLPIRYWLAALYPAAIICLAGIGLFVLNWRRLDGLLPLLFGAVIIAGALVFYGSPRMRAPLEPFLIILASGAILWLSARGRSIYQRLSKQEREPVVARASAQTRAGVQAPHTVDEQ